MKAKTVIIIVILLFSAVLCSCSKPTTESDIHDESSDIFLVGSSEIAGEQCETAEQPAVSPLPVHEATRAFLASLGIIDSTILKIDYNGIKAVKPEFPEIRWNFAEDLYRIFGMDFPLTERNAEDRAEEGDFVLVTFLSRGNDCEEQLWVLTTGKETVLSLQTELIGKRKGEVGTWLWKKTDENDVLPEEPELITYRVDRIMDMDLEAESGKTVLRNNQFRSIEEFYQSFIHVRLRDLKGISQFIGRADYLHGILACCEFSLSEDEVQSHAEVISQTYYSLAAALGISVEQYWENLGYYQAYGAPTDPDFRTSMCLAAEEYIKEQLCMGALAMFMQIDLTVQEVEEFCGYPQTAILDIDWQENCCAVLEDKVLISLEPTLSDSRVNKPRTRLVQTDELREAWLASSEQQEKEREGKTYVSISMAQLKCISEIDQVIGEVNQRVILGEGSEEENKLMQYMPLTRYDGWAAEGQEEGRVLVCLVAEENDMEAAIALFEKIAGKYEIVEYKRITKDEATFHYFDEPAR